MVLCLQAGTILTYTHRYTLVVCVNKMKPAFQSYDSSKTYRHVFLERIWTPKPFIFSGRKYARLGTEFQ